MAILYSYARGINRSAGDAFTPRESGRATKIFSAPSVPPEDAGASAEREILWISGAPERIRTADPQIRSLVLYPAELRALDSAAENRPAGRGIAIVLTAYWQELRRELSRRLRGPGQGLVFDTDSI